MSVAAKPVTASRSERALAEEHFASGVDPDLVATLAHEIRNILSPLSMAFDLLSLDSPDELPASHAKEVIGRQIRQLRRVVNDLLDADRIGHHQLQVTRQVTDASVLLATVCDDYREAFALQHIALTLALPTKPVWLALDAGRFEQVVSNLLSNSLKFTDAGGAVHVELSVDVAARRATLSVSDTGIGIEPAAIDGIFDLREHDSSRRNASGLGLGLPLVKRLVELHGGRVSVHSDGRGNGTRFCILLPLPSTGSENQPTSRHAVRNEQLA
jgi:two-component system, sensor histidine kinase